MLDTRIQIHRLGQRTVQVIVLIDMCWSADRYRAELDSAIHEVTQRYAGEQIYVDHRPV